jgi:hypothetical protein
MSIHIPNSVEVIDESCFMGCASLISVTFESNSRLSRLAKGTFHMCGLLSIHLPGSIEILCESCFALCNSFESITFDSLSRLQRIEKTAFFQTSLTQLTIPSGVSSFSASALAGLTLQSFSFSGISTTYSIRDGFLQQQSGQALIRYVEDAECVSVDSSVEVISESCF